MISVRRYTIRFADGKTSTVLDMEGESPETTIPGLVAKFAPGYVLEVIPV